MNTTGNERLSHLLAEYERTAAQAIANFQRPTGGRGKQGKQRTDAAIRRGAKFSEQLRRLESAIRAQGGTVPGTEPKPAAERPAARPVQPAPVPSLPVPRAMTLEALKAEDAALDHTRREAGSRTITERHRAIKAELGARSAAAARSARSKRAAATRARRKAAGLPPLRRQFTFNNPPPGGWTDADRVN
ncbi:hypothetical protein [Nocardia asiatica]|uniref:hypothetical protein n=1 Tax=Nocardia asiatica TaxID=209252 RepID=UPI00245743A6|nr:hypothetical protein [Nocardia asiatica]